MNRFALDVDARRHIVRGLRLAFFKQFENKLPTEITPEDWWEMQAIYRLAEAIAEPKRGKRPFVNRGREWYFYNDTVTPSRQLEKWEQQLHANPHQLEKWEALLRKRPVAGTSAPEGRSDATL